MVGSGSINDDLCECGFVPDDEDDADQADGDTLFDSGLNTQPTPTNATSGAEGSPTLSTGGTTKR
jgi:hypothetical protein